MKDYKIKSIVYTKNEKIAFIGTLVVLLVGISDLIGWIFDITILRRGASNFVSMSPTAAICFIFISLNISGNLFINDKRLKLLIASLPYIVLCIALINLIDTIFILNINIDSSLIQIIGGSDIIDRRRMAEITAIDFLLIGTIILLKDKVRPNILLTLIAIVLISSLVAITGYIFDVRQLYSFGDVYNISIYTVACLILLNIALIFIIKDNFIVNIFYSRTSSSVMLKTLIPISFLLPLLVITISHYAIFGNLYSQKFGDALEMTLIITLLIAFVLWSINNLYKKDLYLRETRKSEKHLADIVEYSIDAIMSRSLDGKIFSWNKGAENLFGYTKEEMIGKNLKILLPEDKISELHYLMEKSNRGENIEHFETVRKRKNGELIDVSLNVSPIRDENNVITGFSHIARDITQRKRGERALRIASSYNRSLIEASIDPLITIGHDGKITDVNTATEKVTGRRRNELMGTDFSVYFTDPVKALEVYIKVFKEGSVKDYLLEIRHVNGHITPVLYNASTYRDESGKVLGVFAAARDITERRNAERALRRSLSYNRSLIETSIDPLVTIGPDGRITDVNKATELAVGLTRKELIGTDFSDYFTDPEKARYGYLRVFNEGIVKDYALEVRHVNGNITPVLYNATTYKDESGETIGVFAAARDITELIRAEQEIKKINLELEQRVKDRTAELERANKELEAFSYSVSHDLRAPLRGIDGFSKALLEDYQEKIDEEGAHFLNRIRAGVQKMGMLIDDLLRLSRVSRSEISKSKIQVSAMVEDMMKEFTESQPDRKYKLKVEPGITFYADKNLIRILFENLLSNAIKFTAKKDTTVIEFGRCNEGNRDVYFVRDNGVGFEMKYAQNLFGAFQRLHYAGEYEGSGIGLATVQRIIHKHGGEVWAESKPNKGTTIYFTLD